MKFLILNNHKLNLNQFSDNYYLIAIHSDLKEFRLAFFLNQKLKISLIRNRKDISLIDSETCYSKFEFFDEAKYLKWTFFTNKGSFIKKNNSEQTTLFYNENSISYEQSFISGLKTVDYFLIVENIANKIYVEKTLKKILEIKGVIAAFISEKKLENKENLIFS